MDDKNKKATRLNFHKGSQSHNPSQTNVDAKVQINIDTAIPKLEKLAKNPPDEKELKGAKENILGRVEYFSQTNSQVASSEGYNFLIHFYLLGFYLFEYYTKGKMKKMSLLGVKKCFFQSRRCSFFAIFTFTLFLRCLYSVSDT